VWKKTTVALDMKQLTSDRLDNSKLPAALLDVDDCNLSMQHTPEIDQ
jgi:hypothetical protein